MVHSIAANRSSDHSEQCHFLAIEFDRVIEHPSQPTCKTSMGIVVLAICTKKSSLDQINCSVIPHSCMWQCYTCGWLHESSRTTSQRRAQDASLLATCIRGWNPSCEVVELSTVIAREDTLANVGDANRSVAFYSCTVARTIPTAFGKRLLASPAQC